jgi:hypothetical protein
MEETLDKITHILFSSETPEQLSREFEGESDEEIEAERKIEDKKLYSQIQFELSQLLYLFNSRFGNGEPPIEELRKIQTRISELRNQLKNSK